MEPKERGALFASAALPPEIEQRAPEQDLKKRADSGTNQRASV